MPRILHPLMVIVLCTGVSAQTVTEIPAMNVPVSSIDMDDVGPVGPTSLAAINAAGMPNASTLAGINMTPIPIGAGVYNTNTTRGRALVSSGGGLALIDPPSGVFDSFNLRVELGTVSTEFGLGVGDWIGPMVLDFYSAGAMVATFTTTTYTTADPKYFRMIGGEFDRVDVGFGGSGNWVLTDLAIQGPAPAAGACLTTTFDGGVSGPGGSGLYFDVEAKPIEGVSVSALEINATASAGVAEPSTSGRAPAPMWGSSSPTGWTRVATSIPFFTAGIGNPSRVELAEPLFFPQGLTGMVVCSSLGQTYTDGLAAPWIFEDSKLKIFTGSQSPTCLGGMFLRSPRVWNGSLCYAKCRGRRLETSFVGGAGAFPGGGVYFDVDVEHGAGVRVHGLEAHLAAGTTTVEVYTREGTHVGHETSASGWTLRVSVVVAGNGSGVPTEIPLPAPLRLVGGVNGVAMCSLANSQQATIGTTSYSDDIVTIPPGHASAVCLGGPPASVLTPRVWNGRLCYEIVDPDLFQFQFNEPRGTEVANSAPDTPAPASANVSNVGWQADPGRARFGAEPGCGILGTSAGVSATNLVNTGHPLSITGSMTVMWWQRVRVAGNSVTAYAFGGPGGSVRCFLGGAGRIWYRGSTIGDVTSTSDVRSRTNEWVHCALVVDDAVGEAIWYVDGFPDVRTTFPPGTHVATNSEFHVGYNTSTGNGLVKDADLDDFRVYRNALLPQEVGRARLAENSSLGVFGTACPGPSGDPVIGTSGGSPEITSGNPDFAFTLSNGEPGIGWVHFVDFTPKARGTIDLSGFLGSGCLLQIGLTFPVGGVVSPQGSATRPFPIPALPDFKGIHAYGQFLILGGILGSTGAVTQVVDINAQ